MTVSQTLSRAENLRETNRRLRVWLDSIIARPTQAAVAAPDHLGYLLSELLRAGDKLRAQPMLARGDDPDLDREVEEYRGHVERLGELLPSIHRQLLAERASLEAQRSRVRSAAEWAHASRRTL